MANSCVAAVELLWILLPRVTASSSREVTGSRYPDNGRRWDSASKLTSRPQVTRPPGGASHLQTRHPRWSTLAPAREVLQGSWQLGPTAAPALVSSVLSLGRFSTSQRQGLKNCHLSKSSSLRDDLADWPNNYVKPIVAGASNRESGILTLMAIRDFNGSGFVNDHDEETVDKFKAFVMYEDLSIEENCADLPSKYVRSIDD